MEAKEVAKDITVAILNRMNMPVGEDVQAPSKWAAKCYKIIFDAVLHPELERD